MSENALVPEVETTVALMPANLFAASSPAELIKKAVLYAESLADVIRKKHLYTTINGKNYVFVEGWTLLGSMLGVFPICVWSKQLENGWEARVEARTLSGQIVGAAEASCLRSESKWKSRDDYALRSMAQTRATSKGLRLPLGFIMVLAGYEATPADEMSVEADAKIVAPTGPETPPEQLSARGQTTEEHLDAAAVNRNSSVAQYTHCSDCGAEIKQFPSESKDFPGRLYWQCEGARFEYLDAVKNGVPVAKAKAQIKNHFGGGSRLWAETWPRPKGAADVEKLESAPPVAQPRGGDSSGRNSLRMQMVEKAVVPDNAPVKSIKEQLEDIEKDTAARLKAERVAELSQGFNEATRT